ncbi:hypothetical protein Sme01_21460 [Sphaerisporangium melleum]|uniref:Uncharacterized protein n=1 Tax=Sphaerisporangium melleum TaxID=321316 RepID=A0A917QZB8_9ACTN|nr:hypothetical protein [Sphaerisporangium melleum]GGK79708.1 hypothetical protein GCM10007964_22920 [Sphaerisporangium melleum]GII69670.1 hypothetical protein Sme01_21460 [Sphaerisporangium melleum]
MADTSRSTTGPAVIPAAPRPRRVQARRPRRRADEECQDLRTPSGRVVLPY